MRTEVGAESLEPMDATRVVPAKGQRTGLKAGSYGIPKSEEADIIEGINTILHNWTY